MDTREDILRYNKTVREKNLVKTYVENTDETPVVSLCRAAGLSDKDILDVGCATGALAYALYRAFGDSGLWRSYIGVDLDEDYLREFGSRGIPKCHTMPGDATKLPVKDGTKDVVLLLFVLQHLTKQEGCAAIAELKRVTRAGASVIVAATVHPDQSTKERLYAAGEVKRAGGPEVPTTTWNKDELIKTLEASGLQIAGSEKVQGRGNLIKLYLRATLNN